RRTGPRGWLLFRSAQHRERTEYMPLGRKLAVEFVGTFFRVFTVGLATNPKAGAGGGRGVRVPVRAAGGEVIGRYRGRARERLMRALGRGRASRRRTTPPRLRRRG